MPKEITPAMREALRAPLPPEALKPHPSKTYLTAIKPIFVVERLNNVFGVGSWTQESEVINNSNSPVVYSTLTVPEYGIKLTAFGGNDNGGENSKGFDLGDAFKGAATDALTKMCSYLEIGIDVYKSGTSKSAPASATDGAPKVVRPPVKPAAEPAKPTEPANTPAPVNTPAPNKGSVKPVMPTDGPAWDKIADYIKTNKSFGYDAIVETFKKKYDIAADGLNKIQLAFK